LAVHHDTHSDPSKTFAVMPAQAGIQ
jgi:hypothetical protein